MHLRTIDGTYKERMVVSTSATVEDVICEIERVIHVPARGLVLKVKKGHNSYRCPPDRMFLDIAIGGALPVDVNSPLKGFMPVTIR